MNDSFLIDYFYRDIFQPATERKLPIADSNVEKVCGMYGTATEIQAIKIFHCFLIPALGVVGILFNSFFIAVLQRSDLQEPTNIFLLSLIIADLLNVVNNWNYAYILYFHGSGAAAIKECEWEYDYSLNVFLFVSDRLFTFISEVGGFVVSYMPVVITSERVLAVYIPLKCKRIFTKKSAKYICVTVYLFWIPYGLFSACLHDLHIVRMADGKFRTRAVLSEFAYANLRFLLIFQKYGINVFCNVLPNMYVTFCCVLIGVKLQLVMRKRKKLFRGQKRLLWSPRTTRTLLFTCLVLAVNHVSCGILVLIFQTGSLPTAFSYLKMISVGLLSCLGTPFNFLIYVTSNRKLWRIFQQLFTIKNKNI